MMVPWHCHRSSSARTRSSSATCTPTSRSCSPRSSWSRSSLSQRLSGLSTFLRTHATGRFRPFGSPSSSCRFLSSSFRGSSGSRRPTRRVITRTGIIKRTGHDLPLTRISDIQIEKDFDDRIFGCGTLALQTSADDPLLLRDVPKVETVQVEISNLIFNDVQGAIDADPTS